MSCAWLHVFPLISDPLHALQYCVCTSQINSQLSLSSGNDAAGIVVEVGAGVSAFKPGDKVYTTNTLSGAYAEFTRVIADSLHLVPASLSFTEAAALPTPYLTAFRALIQRGKARPSDTVLIHGASGGVGVAAVQFARAYGMTVFGTAGTEKGLDIVKRAGAHQLFNHREKDYTASMLTATGNSGFNVIVENAAHINLGKDLEMLSPGGCVAVVGSRGLTQVNPRDAMSREASVVGVMLFQASGSELAEAHAAIRGGAEAGWLKPIVGKQYPLSNAAAAHKEIMEGSGALGKMVLTVE